MIRFAVTWVFVVTCAALAVSHVSQTVERLEAELAEQQRAILQHQEAIHVLEAEWSYLNRPERISLLAERYLALAPLSADDVVGLDDLPQRLEPGQGLAGQDLDDDESENYLRRATSRRPQSTCRTSWGRCSAPARTPGRP